MVSLVLRRKLRRPQARVVAAVLIAAIALSIGMAHSAVGTDHMGDAVVMCLAIGAATAALASAPRLGRRLAPRTRPRKRTEPLHIRAVPEPILLGRARGHPSLLQVFMR
jgi:hypothetical protein